MCAIERESKVHTVPNMLIPQATRPLFSVKKNCENDFNVCFEIVRNPEQSSEYRMEMSNPEAKALADAIYAELGEK